MFKKILIANRGEIAVRIMRTCKKLGIRTVAVYSEADAQALHVQEADEAVFIGPSPSTQSYLNIPKLVRAIQDTEADAVHPGYGFLSEKSAFAEAVEKAGAVFIGPPPKAIASMGDKLEAKKIAKKAGVNIVPGTEEPISDPVEAAKICKKIGYPVMIKAAAGGGGKGMRVVHDEEGLKEALRGAASEAGSSFGDNRVFIEKFIENPHHIEIQILADKHGNIVSLGERECSLQRRHQKIIEEAPSPFIDKRTRVKMGRQAMALAKAVGYFSAGTVEFIMDGKKNFYFLEMNTRLQVEHRVTEFVTRVDLVEQMIRIAAGEKLPFGLKDIKFNGWSIESRIYAEDPSRGFLPSTGRITRYHAPDPTSKMIVDSGVYEGGEVSMFYDPMVAKVITFGPTREEAIEEMKNALGVFMLRGISNNMSFLEAILNHERFIQGNVTTNFLQEEYPHGFGGVALTPATKKIFLAAAMHIHLREAERAGQITGQLPGRQRPVAARWDVRLGEESTTVYVKPKEYGYDITYENTVVSVRSSWQLGKRLFQGTVDGKQVSVKIEYVADGYRLTHGGSTLTVMVRSPQVAELGKYMPVRRDGGSHEFLKAPITGMVRDVRVQEGDEVKLGQDLVVIEAMKMENIICAEAEAKVKKIKVKAGESVAADQVMIEFEKAA